MTRTRTAPNAFSAGLASADRAHRAAEQCEAWLSVGEQAHYRLFVAIGRRLFA